jgi:radical SAM protein with 4Fe4S-binding SPASM domain
MNVLMEEMNRRALALGIPLGAQLDVTYRCNERCVHCYLDHDDHGELTTAEMKDILDQLADAGTLFLTLSGGEVFMRMDFFKILEYARELSFCIKIKTNAFMIREKEADLIRNMDVSSVQVSIYSHRPEVHDAITLLPRSLERSIKGIRLMQQRGVKVIIANVLMRQNIADYEGVRQLARSLGVESTIDPTVTPKMDGDRSILGLGIGGKELRDIMHNADVVGNVDDFCATPPPVGDEDLDMVPCSASHTYCYISPYGDVFPCVQFPLPTGNVRKQKFLDIWRYSPQMNDVRSIRPRELPVCSTCSHIGTCTRCPGLAYMQGDMRGPSVQDCEKSYARTGIPSANMKLRFTATGGHPVAVAQPANLVQIQLAQAC